VLTAAEGARLNPLARQSGRVEQLARDQEWLDRAALQARVMADVVDASFDREGRDPLVVNRLSVAEALIVLVRMVRARGQERDVEKDGEQARRLLEEAVADVSSRMSAGTPLSVLDSLTLLGRLENVRIHLLAGPRAWDAETGPVPIVRDD
jgi:hypothetical protein